MTLPDKTPLVVCISLDVEEEGLFGGKYPRRGTVENVGRLTRLEPLFHELGLPLTLLCSHAVFANAEARRTLEHMRDKCNAEIGAHLHHWCTPPDDLPALQNGRPMPSNALPRETLLRRLEELFRAGRDFQGAPLTSFRMGRWDLWASWRPLLAEFGVKTDSSVCPLRKFAGGPDHFLAPQDPYWVEDGLLEAPITQIPFSATLARLWKAGARGRVADAWHFFGAVSPNPFWHSARMMRLAARLHAARKGKVLSLFWHSSEMLPGASPHVPDEAAADAALAKIFAFCRWLRQNFTIQPATLSQLYQMAPILDFPARPKGGGGDW